MEIALAPLTSLPNRELHCPVNIREKWPNLQVEISEKNPVYSYPLIDDSSNDFYFQQVDHNEFSHPLKTYTFDIPTPVNFHVEVGYNFLVGDLLLKLKMGTNTIFGKNSQSRNFITVKNLPRGTYTLTIYEPTSNVAESIGCSHFSFLFFYKSSNN